MTIKPTIKPIIKPTSRKPEIVFEHSSAIPVVDAQVLFQAGAAHDPKGLEGLHWATARMLRMGTSHHRAPNVEDTIATLGGHLGIDVGMTHIRIVFSCLARTQNKLLDFLSTLLNAPAFRENDLAQVKREARASLEQRRDSDRTLAQLHFRNFLYANHKVGRVVTPQSIDAWSVDAMRALYATWKKTAHAVVGFSGKVNTSNAQRWFESLFQPEQVTGEQAVYTFAEPHTHRTFRLRLVDKPDRTQTQIVLGALGLTYGDPRYEPLALANTVFGGTFSSRLTQAVRAERGWSYNAASHLGVDSIRDVWSMWTFPAAKDTADCLALQRQLFESWIQQGITQTELDFAKQSLVRGFAFERDTPMKRLNMICEEKSAGLPEGYYQTLPDRLAEVTLTQANDTLRTFFADQQLTAVVVGTAADIEPALRALPDVKHFEVVPFTSL